MSRFRVLALAVVLALSPLAVAAPGVGNPVRPHAAGLGLAVTAQPLRGTAPLAISFEATPTPASRSATFRWSFGDGASYVQTGVLQSAPIHEFVHPGNYSVNVSATEGTVEANASLLVAVFPENLSVVVVATPTSGPAPLTVEFHATFAGGTGTYTSVFWTFGDGDIGSGGSINYTYSSAGDFLATVNVTDSSGTWRNSSVAITVSSDPAPAPRSSSSGFGPYLAALGVATAVLAATAIVVAIYRSLVLRRASRIDAPPGAVLEAVPPAIPAPVRAAPAPAAVAAAASEGPVAERNDSRRLSERILIHLYWHGRSAPDGIARAEASQQGIARSLGSEQNVLSKPLRRLVDSGLVRVELAHVPGAPRRVKAYFLTPRGEALARAMSAASRPPPGDPNGDS